jgi:hypothetical protein
MIKTIYGFLANQARKANVEKMGEMEEFYTTDMPE